MATIHGHTGKAYGLQSPTYISWQKMRQRCCDPKHPSYAKYGAKGVTVCERWMTFENFLADMGERPAGHTLDRKESDKGYEPGNCKWSTPKEQARGRRHLLTHNGETLSITDWAIKLGVNRRSIKSRLTRGWSVEDALTVPMGGK